MNRNMRRKIQQQADRGMKKKLTEEQYSDLKSDITMELAEQIAKDKFNAMFGVVIDKFAETMRENGISQDRCKKIIAETADKIMSEFGGKVDGVQA